MTTPEPARYVSRGGLKLEAGLDAAGIDPAGLWCVDLGCSTGGFTDCLLKRGARRVYAVDTAYGELAWTLRNDERVVVMERTNALHAEPDDDARARAGVDLAVIDLGWTPQARAIPAALRWLKPDALIVTLIKPHYEVDKPELAKGGVLDPDRAAEVAREVAGRVVGSGFQELAYVESPVQGGKTKNRGNREWLLALRRSPNPQP
ncbi:MAG: SAM-dependent methyltransferase [Planctomycetota bacterium]